jgi:murein DD-endopeptidase MepM/ murein hydrolase activator NlpD
MHDARRNGPVNRRQMARPVKQPSVSRGRLGLRVLVAGLLMLVTLGGGFMLLRQAPSDPTLIGLGESASPAATAQPSTRTPMPFSAPSASRPPATSAATPTPSPLPSATSSPRPSPTPAPTRDPNAAPQTSAEFDLQGQAIDIFFPLAGDAHYRYRDNFLQRRAGDAVAFNHARLASDGRIVRLHDGIDIYSRAGEPVLSPFSGVVVDPRSRWRPWNQARYGVTVVVVSDEPSTAGYAAVMVHLNRADVEIGERVERGEVVGMLGDSGNADGVHPHLHFELRAPFGLDWSEMGQNRRIDAFNPFPSLDRADPNR